MLKLFNRILASNYEGVQLIIGGHYFNAKKAFREALVRLKQCEDRQKGRKVGQKSSSRPTSSPLALETRSIPNFLNKKKTSVEENTRHYIFRNVLVVSMDPKIENPSDSLITNIISCLTAIVIFNLSVASHWNANYSGWSSADLKQVLRLYSKAWEALYCESCSLLKEHPIYREAIILATLNNMGALYHNLTKFKKYQQCFKTLRQVLSSNTGAIQTLLPEDHRGMVMNAMFIDQASTACAA
mmetsp:Transcript_7886/g.12061  ORF Transcript_7886/g.12061 Transcript_7886/m.12061 type:complete len:242 (-) Transcript_7886:83-808(-)